MSVRPCHHRVPRARIDPIGAAAALRLLMRSIRVPHVDETLVLVLDDAHRGVGIVSVDGTVRPDQVVDVVECLARPELFGGDSAALVVASMRPGGGVDTGDVDRWLEMCDLADAAGLELVEWFVIGSEITRPRDLLGMPPRWHVDDARPG